MIGCDVRNMTAETFEILSNEEVIAVNQGNGVGGGGVCVCVSNFSEVRFCYILRFMYIQLHIFLNL